MFRPSDYTLLRKPDDPRDLLLTPHVRQPEDPRRIRLWDCARRRYEDFRKAEVEQVSDPERLARRVAELVRPGRPARLARRAPRPARPAPEPAPPARRSAPPLRNLLSPRELGEHERARFRDSGSGDRDLAVMEFRGVGGLLHTVLFDPGAQDVASGRTLYLVIDGFPRWKQVVALPGKADFGRLPGRRAIHRRGRVEEIVAAYRAWQNDLRMMHARAQAGTALARLAHDHPRTPFTLNVAHDALRPDADDVRLAIRWSEWRNRDALGAWYEACGGTLAGVRAGCGRLRNDQREDLQRTLSARVAEKAARWVYARHGTPPPRDVHDVAIGQLAPGEDPAGTPEYKRCDLAVVTDDGTEWVDVKNARSSRWMAEHDASAFGRSLSAVPRGTYIEHCVPAFKKARDQQTGVKIAGVFSPLAGLRRILDAEYSDEVVTFLGESSEALCDDLRAEFQRDGELVLTFGSARVRDARRDAVFLPPWMFILPAGWYPGCDARCASAVDAARVLGPGWVPGRGLWAFCIASGAASELPAWTGSIEAPWRSFVDRLCELRGRGRLTLPYVYLATLSHFLRTVRTLGPGGRLPGQAGIFAPAGYRDYIFSQGPTDRPLGLYDPLRSVDRLIDSLTLLMRGDLGRIGSFREFHFSHAGSLKTPWAASGTGSATLLFPYCGGGCGREHLVLGAAGTDLCPACGHLICPSPECRFCHSTDACKRAADERKRRDARHRWYARR